MTRIAIVDPQPAVRAGLTALLRSEPGLVPVGSPARRRRRSSSSGAPRPTSSCSSRTSVSTMVCSCAAGSPADGGPRVVAYTEASDPALEVALRVACADGVVSKHSTPQELFEALRIVARGRTALPPLTPAQLRAAAARVESDDLALLAMLVDRTRAADVRETLKLDRRRFARRVERLLRRLRPRRGTPAPA